VASSAVQPLSRDQLFRWLLDHASLLILPAICLLPIILAAPFFNEPFEGDEGVYGTIAQGILKGEVPYRDLFDHKPPLIYLWYVFSFQVFGESVVAPRFMSALVWSLTTIVVYKQALLLFGRDMARGAALVFALSAGLVLLQANANTEAFMLLPLTLSLYALTRGLHSDNARWFLAAGVFGAIAVFTKQIGGLNLAAGALVLGAYCLRRSGFRLAFRQVLALCLGFGLAAMLGLIPFVLLGALNDFIYANWTYNRLYATEEPLNLHRVARDVEGLRFFFIAAGPLVLLSILGLLSTLRERRWEGLLLGAWLVGGFSGIFLSGRAFPHYYVSLLAVLAILTPAGAVALRMPSLSSRVFTGMVLASALLCVTVNLNVYLQPTPEAKHSARFARTQPEIQNRSPDLGAYIASITGPDERIYNYGREAQIYFYADRLPAGRFLYNRSFFLDPPTMVEAVAELSETKPKVIVDSASLLSDPTWKEDHPPAVQRFLLDNYSYAGQVEFADIYLLRPR
jgi:Dolichyl-phosphate-mannose-protein mannosyltransferase